MDQRIDIGIDGGGTGCRVVVAMAERQARGTGGPANAMTDPAGAEAAIRGALMQALGELGLRWDDLARARIVAGMAGCRLPGSADEFAMRLPFLAQVVEDSVTALEGAFGGGHGTLVNLGTGSFFIRRDGRGITHMGGWGFHLGDEGSAAWLGQRALSDMMQIGDGRLPHYAGDPLLSDLDRATAPHPVVFASHARPEDYAALTPLILAARSPWSEALVRRITTLLRAALHDLGHPVGSPWALTGGLGQALGAWIDAEAAEIDDADSRDILSGHFRPGGSSLDGALSMARALP